MVDSIGGSGRDPSRDSSIDTRRRILEEERGRDLDRIEKKYQQDVSTVQEARDRSLRAIAESRESQVAEKQNDTEELIARTKAAADARVKAYRDSSARLVEDAHRHYQSKAGVLAKTAKELDEQRQFLQKQHNSSVAHSNSERERQLEQNITKHKIDSARIQNRQEGLLRSQQEQNESELTRLSQDFSHRKLKETEEAEKSIAQVKNYRDQNMTSLQSEIQLQERTAAQQLNRERMLNQIAHQAEQGESEEQMAELRSKFRGEVTKAAKQGKTAVDQTKEFYNHQVDTLTKDAVKRSKDIQNQSMIATQKLQSDAKVQEHVAQTEYQFRKDQLKKSQELSLADHNQKTAELKEKMDKDYLLQSKHLTSTKTGLLTNQREQAQKEILFQRDFGQKQLDAQVAGNAKSLSSHGSKAADPFYQAQNIGAQLSDQGTEVVVSLSVPEHEQNSIRVTQQPGKITVSGTRRSEARAKAEGGREIATNSYQSYSEVLPTSGKLDMGKMQKSYSGGTLTFRIPKA